MLFYSEEFSMAPTSAPLISKWEDPFMFQMSNTLRSVLVVGAPISLSTSGNLGSDCREIPEMSVSNKQLLPEARQILLDSEPSTSLLVLPSAGLSKKGLRADI